jgi:hypothetical protein
MRLVLVSFSILLLSPPLSAESYTGGQNNNPFANAGASASIPPVRASDSGFFSNTANIFDNSAQNNQNGLEYKLQDAGRQANAGQGAALTAGGLLTGAGVAALLAMNYAEAGRLFGLAGLEFAQAGASNRTNLGNLGNRGTLLANANQNSNGYDPVSVANSLATPEARQALAAQGVNPDDFLRQLASGNIRSGAEAAAALGHTSTPAAELNDYSSVNVAGIIGSGEGSAGEEFRSLLGVSDDEEGTKATDSPVGALSTLQNNPGSTASSSDSASDQKSSAPSRGIASIGTTAVGQGPDRVNAGGANGSGSFGLSALGLGLPSGDETAGDLSRTGLMAVGITKTKGQNIFGLAGRNYRSFSKWRVIQKLEKPRRKLASQSN